MNPHLDKSREVLGLLRGLDEVREAVKVERLEVVYDGMEEPAIEDVTLKASLGEMVLLAGPNGGGKTTLLRAIAGLIKPRKGLVRVLGRDPYKDLAVRRLIAYVPQIKELNIHAPLTVWDLVSFGRYPHIGPLGKLTRRDLEAIEISLEKVRLETQSSKKLSELSGGQLNRAVIARALAQDPVIYLLDEPFESIDRATENIILNVLAEEKKKGKLIIITEHHINELEHFDKAYLINHRILDSGNPVEILEKLELIR